MKIPWPCKADEQIAQRVQLCFVEDREKVGPAKQNQSSDIVQRVEKSDCSRDRNQYNHQQRPCLADTAQQPVERDAQTNENYVSRRDHR
jgi:hypothetical protein